MKAWDFKKLPESEWVKVKQYLNEQTIFELVNLHDKYKLSEYNYCCEGTTASMLNWWNYGLKKYNEGLFKKGKEGNTQTNDN